MGTLRVLHVCAPGSPGGGSCLLRLLAATRRAAPQDGVLLLGPAGASREAALVGLGPHWRLPPLLGAPALLRVPLRRAIAAWRPLLLHAWDAESALLLARIAPDLEGAPPMAATLTAVREPAGAAPLSLDRMEALCIGDRARHQAAAFGWLPGRLRSVMPPRMAGPAGSRAALRRRWGAGEGTRVVLVSADPWSAADGRVAFDAAGRAFLAGQPVKLVVEPRIAQAHELWRLDRLTQLGGLVVVEPEAALPWRVAPGADVHYLPEAVHPLEGPHRSRWRAISGPPSGALGAAWSAAEGLCVVAPRNGPVDQAMVPQRLSLVDPGPNLAALALGEVTQVRGGADGGTDANTDANANTHAVDRVDPSWLDEVAGLYARAGLADAERWYGSRSLAAASA